MWVVCGVDDYVRTAAAPGRCEPEMRDGNRFTGLKSLVYALDTRDKVDGLYIEWKIYMYLGVLCERPNGQVYMAVYNLYHSRKDW